MLLLLAQFRPRLPPVPISSSQSMPASRPRLVASAVVDLLAGELSGPWWRIPEEVVEEEGEQSTRAQQGRDLRPRKEN